MEIKKVLKISAATAALVASFSACSGGGEETEPESLHHTALCTSDTTTAISGTISSNATWGASSGTACYSITGTVKVNASTLTIEPGTIVYGTTATSYLAILPGAAIDAQGNATSPIVFTSAEEVAGYEGKQGQWGGLSIFGNAVSNKGTEQYEADATITFGSSNSSYDTESSGTLDYVMVRNTGYAVTADAELNGLSLGGVGNGTTITNVASINGKDDGIEIWGGTVNLTNVYIESASDDSFDLDHGYRGTADNMKIVCDSTSDRGIEADSKSTSDAGSPVATPTIKNMTITTDAASDAAMHWREGIQPTLENVVINYNGTKASTYAIEVADNATAGTQILSATNVEIISTGSADYSLDGVDTSSSLPSGVTHPGSATANNGANATAFDWISTYETAKGL